MLENNKWAREKKKTQNKQPSWITAAEMENKVFAIQLPQGIIWVWVSLVNLSIVFIMLSSWLQLLPS